MGNTKIFDIVDTIYRSCDGDKIHKVMKQISRFHRIQASEGYRQSALVASDILRQHGIENEIKSYPADLKTKCFTQTMFREWNCSEAWLDVTSPWKERLACFSIEEMSIIQRSADGDFLNEDVEIVYIPENVTPESITEDLVGKIIFVENGFDRWVSKMMEFSIAAIITVSMPEIKPVRVNMSEDERLKNAHANLSFHHYTKESEKSLRGFSITPASGKKLKEACLELEKEGKKPTARFKVKSSIEDGTIENVEACIPGELREEVLMTAHLCHPRSSVNDNASGAACAMEAMRVLRELIENGILPKPRRTMKMLLIPEFTGTFAYLAENEKCLNQIVGGFNMDMVAGRQDGTAGPLIIVDTPDCSHSFSGDLGEMIFKGLSRECAFGGDKVFVPLFSSVRVPFVFGSDHYILSDPTVDIPCVALTQWPDKNYHTSADDAAHVDEMMLKRAAATAAAYCYIYASMDKEYVEELLPITSRRFYERIDVLRRSEDTLKAEKAAHLEGVIYKTLDRYQSLLTEEEYKDAETLFETERLQYHLLLSALGEKENTKASGIVPERLFKGPVQMRCILATMSQDQKNEYQMLCNEYPALPRCMDYILYETDGTRSVEEIAMAVRCQTDVDCSEFLVKFFELFKELGLIKFHE